MIAYSSKATIAYSSRWDSIVFRGNNLLTGKPIEVVFNKPAPRRSNLLMWNGLLNKWMYSRDAGLTWNPVNENDFLNTIHQSDLVLAWKESTPKEEQCGPVAAIASLWKRLR